MQGIRADILRNRVGVVTSRWIDNTTDDEADSLKCAKIDIEDLDAADTVIAFGDVVVITSNSGMAWRKASGSCWWAIVRTFSIFSLKSISLRRGRNV